ncbi:MAG: 30S ribosomal protein S9 [Planctomycetota bacterium]
MVATAKKDKITGDALGTGRRKSSVARVRIREGSGKVLINKRDMTEFFCNEQDRNTLLAPLIASGKQGEVDVLIRVHGGGTTGQAGACRMGIARALVSLDEEHFPTMRDGGFLTRDSRMKERKKYGLRGARRGTQFSKR